MSTFLTDDLPNAEQKTSKRVSPDDEKEAIEIATMIRQALFDAYADGEITFEAYCRMVLQALSVESIPGFMRQKMLGAAVESALGTTPLKRTAKSSRSSFNWKNKVCYDLVELVANREDLSKVKITKTGKTAFLRTAEILNSRGISITERAVYNAWSKWPKEKRIPSKSK